jgi:hypothetical protein
MTTKNKLPRYWVVKCEPNNPNWRKVIDCLKSEYNEYWNGYRNGYRTDYYYGYDGNAYFGGTDCNYCVSDFINNPTILTIQKFVEMTEGFVIPEKWFCKPTNKQDAFILGKYFDDNQCGCGGLPHDFYQTDLELVLRCGLSNNNFGIGYCSSHKEITFEQFKEHVLKQKEEAMRTITHVQAQQIIDIACTTWKDKLFTLWGKSIVLKQLIEISDSDYREMRKACTAPQNVLFDEIFCKFEVGDWVSWTGQNPLTAQIVRKCERFSNCWVLNEKTHDSCDQRNLRYATEEEIQKAKYIPKDTPCLVRGSSNVSWKLAYSTGDGKFRAGDIAYGWNQVKVLDMNELPDYSQS